MPSSDTVLKRLKELSADSNLCFAKRGTVSISTTGTHILEKLNLQLLEKLGAFFKDEITIDYDNTILFTEKSDSKMTYKEILDIS